MSLLKYDDVMKFANTFDEKDLDMVLKGAGVKNTEDAISFFERKFNNDLCPVFVDDGLTVSIFFDIQHNRYLESYDNPLGDDEDFKYIEFKEFKTIEERDNFMSNANKKSVYLVEKYEHGSVHYSLSRTGEYPDRRWDVTPDCAVVILSNEAKAVRKALYSKYGDGEGEVLFKKQINELLDKYSSYRNGFSYEAVELIVDKNTGEISEEYLPICFSNEDLKNEYAASIFHKISKERRNEIESEIIEITNEKDAFKGFDNNVMRKGSIGAKVFKHESEDGLESKLAVIAFDHSAVTYIKTPYELPEYAEPKNKQFMNMKNKDFYMENRKNTLASIITIGEFNENVKRYTLESQNKSGLKI